MESDVFWGIIDRARSAMIEDIDANMQALDAALRELPPEDIIAFGRWFTLRYNQAYTWPLWAAAYTIGGGCSDDGFMDFRGWLISRGKAVYEAALSDPDSLADILDGEEEGQNEGYSYIVGNIIEECYPEYQERLFEQTSYKTIDFPSEPSGTYWEEDEAALAKLCPRLFKMYWQAEK